MDKFLQDLISLGFLILLQAVLGFDNLLYISIESRRVAPEKQARVRALGIGLAVLLRLVLLAILLAVLDSFKEPWFALSWGFVEGEFNFHSLIVLLGGGFIIYTAVKEVFHMMHIDESVAVSTKPKSTVGKAVFWIVLMNLIFSFDSILSTIALTKTIWVMIVAIVVTGVLMVVLAGTVSEFLKKNRMYEVLGLFILLIVGVMLLTEGGHLAHLKLFGNEITPMTKTTFYFVIAVLVLSDVAQSRYQKKLLARRDAEAAQRASAEGS